MSYGDLWQHCEKKEMPFYFHAPDFEDLEERVSKLGYDMVDMDYGGMGNFPALSKKLEEKGLKLFTASTGKVTWRGPEKGSQLGVYIGSKDENQTHEEDTGLLDPLRRKMKTGGYKTTVPESERSKYTWFNPESMEDFTKAVSAQASKHGFKTIELTRVTGMGNTQLPMNRVYILGLDQPKLGK